MIGNFQNLPNELIVFMLLNFCSFFISLFISILKIFISFQISICSIFFIFKIWYFLKSEIVFLFWFCYVDGCLNEKLSFLNLYKSLLIDLSWFLLELNSQQRFYSFEFKNIFSKSTDSVSIISSYTFPFQLSSSLIVISSS